MERTPRTGRLALFIICAVLSAAVFTAASAAATRKPVQHGRATCVVYVTRHTGTHSTRVRRLVPCRRRRATIAVKGRGISAAQSLSPAVSGALDVGLNTSVASWTDQASRMNEIISQSGTHWMREAFDWSQIERTRGSYDFSRYDTLMSLAAQNNVQILADLVDTPSWAGSSWNTIPSNPSAFADFVATLVNRYGPHGSFWSTHPNLPNDGIATFELWNEPYYSNGDSGDYNPGRYARLVKAAGAAGHAADSSAKFLLAADNESQQVNGTWVWWVDALYKAVPNLNKYFDGVAVHPYGTDLTNVQFPTPGKAYNGYAQVRRLETVRQQFVNHGASDKPLWITEIGWPTCTAGGSDRCTTAAGQARDIQTIFNNARGSWKRYVQAVLFYGYQDNNANTADPENDYGLVNHDGTPKPALGVFRANA